MPRRKPKKNNLSKEQELDLKNKLDSIVLADEMLAGLSTPDIPPIKPQRFINVDNVKNEVESEARAILDSLSKFYNDMESLPEDHYIKHKQKIDSLAISTMAFQIRTAQHAITKLIEEIDSGRVERGLFEVLAQLQNQIMQMPKNFSNYMTQMEKNYKQLKTESEEMKKQADIMFDENGNIVQTPENIEALKVRGTKSLMENLQTLMKGGNMVKEAEIVPIEDDLINPRTKDGGNLDLLGGAEDDDFEIEDDLFN
jgi:ElaB/YqjD/DUF883 family membrane-anchored ribosome-binding protein